VELGKEIDLELALDMSVGGVFTLFRASVQHVQPE
jgi:hypothetical protein